MIRALIASAFFTMTGTVCFLAIWGSLNPMCGG